MNMESPGNSTYASLAVRYTNSIGSNYSNEGTRINVLLMNVLTKVFFKINNLF